MAAGQGGQPGQQRRGGLLHPDKSKAKETCETKVMTNASEVEACVRDIDAKGKIDCGMTAERLLARVALTQKAVGERFRVTRAAQSLPTVLFEQHGPAWAA